jgi:hypothetical protein
MTRDATAFKCPALSSHSNPSGDKTLRSCRVVKQFFAFSEHKVVVPLMVGRTALLRLATAQDACNIGPAFGHGTVKLEVVLVCRPVTSEARIGSVRLVRSRATRPTSHEIPG